MGLANLLELRRAMGTTLVGVDDRDRIAEVDESTRHPWITATDLQQPSAWRHFGKQGLQHPWPLHIFNVMINPRELRQMLETVDVVRHRRIAKNGNGEFGVMPRSFKTSNVRPAGFD